MAHTKIEWCDTVWNPVTGCTPVSEGCEHCYARRMATRLRGRCGYPEDDTFRVTLHPERLEEPLKWKKPRRVFVNSMGDLFHPDVPFEFISKVLHVIWLTDEHIFMILTKRPKRMLQYFKREETMFEIIDDDTGCDPLPLSNLWLGVTAENQQAADERIPILLQIPAAVRFVSVEPMLGPVNLFRAFGTEGPRQTYIEQLDWVICGGETGPGARPCHPEWVRSLKDQCRAAGVPFFFKSWGEWLPNDVEYGCHNEQANYDVRHAIVDADGRIREPGDIVPGAVIMAKMGKKTAGRLLDSREWNEVPERMITCQNGQKRSFNTCATTMEKCQTKKSPVL